MQSIDMRRRGGEIRVRLQKAHASFFTLHTAESFIEYCFTAIAFVFGCKVAGFLHDRCFLYLYSVCRATKTRCEPDLRIKKICRTRFYRGVKVCGKIYPFPLILQYSRCKAPVLYHATPHENEKSIMAEGLKPGSREFVYLADSRNYYTAQRKTWFGKSPVLLQIDVQQLSALGHSVYRNADGEYVTDFVPTECIIGCCRLFD